MDALKQDALFHTLMETAVDGIVLIDSKATVKAFNSACEALFGYAASEVIGRNVKMLMPEPYRESHDGYVEHYQKTGEKRIIGIGREVVGKRKDGNTFPMYLSVGEGVLGGERIYVGIIHDLTVRDETARRMRVMQAELLHVSRLSAMGQMTAALAHELNQPLTAIMNYVTAARRFFSSGDPAQSTRGVELIEKAVQQTARAGQIIKRLREFVEKRETARTEQNLNEAVEEAIALAFAGSSDAGVKLNLGSGPIKYLAGSMMD